MIPNSILIINCTGYPDISLLGVKYIVSINGSFYPLDGTSASCPVAASMVSLVNSARLASGRSTLGEEEMQRRERGREISEREREKEEIEGQRDREGGEERKREKEMEREREGNRGREREVERKGR